MTEAFDLSRNPLDHFLSLYEEAVKLRVPDPHAMVLSTVDAENHPSSRVVYFKKILRNEIAFFTNYEGRKSQDIEKNPHAALNFFWSEMQVQIRVEGEAQKTTRGESEDYFKTRQRLSQLGAWASRQSQPLPDSETLEAQVDFFDQKFAGQEVPCPPNWGGFRLVASRYEFWFGRQGRLHRRYLYVKKDGSWETSLLSP